MGNLTGIYKLRDRKTSDRPKPIPEGVMRRADRDRVERYRGTRLSEKKLSTRPSFSNFERKMMEKKGLSQDFSRGSSSNGQEESKDGQGQSFVWVRTDYRSSGRVSPSDRRRHLSRRDRSRSSGRRDSSRLSGRRERPQATSIRKSSLPQISFVKGNP